MKITPFLLPAPHVTPGGISRGALKIASLLLSIGLIGVTPATFASDTKASELLEQGVYSEETKGDLDGAIQLYRQVIADANASQALGAQAQFHLALCLEKKKDPAAAMAAFEKLVRDYPNQKQLVALANEHLASGPDLLPVPWVDGEQLEFDVNLPSGYRIGVARYSVVADKADGREIWRFSSSLFAGGIRQWSRLEVDASSFKPIHCQWKHTLFGEYDTVYAAGGAEVKLKGKDDVKHTDLSGAVYDNEEGLPLMRRLPLANGSTADLNLFVWAGGGRILPFKLTKETSEMGQRLIFFAGYVLVLAATLIPAMLLGAVPFFLLQWLTGNLPLAVLAAAITASAALMGEFAVVVWRLGRRYEKFDLSAELPR